MECEFFSVVVFALFASSAFAQEWRTDTTDDLFSGKKVGTMIGGMFSPLGVYATCQDNRHFVMSLIFKMDKPGDIQPLDGMLAIKVDDLTIHRIKATSYTHNDQYAGFRAEPDDVEAIAAIREIGEAKRKIVVGLDVPEISIRQSAQIPTSGSTKAVAALVKACEL